MEACASLLNNEFERVIYKVVYGFRTTILNLYMVSLVKLWCLFQVVIH